jgi:hypothetical protein
MMLSILMREYSMPKRYLVQYQPNVKVMALAQAQAHIRFTALAMILATIFFFSFWESLVWHTLAGG